MLFIALIIAALLYAGLYLVWLAASPHLQSPPSTLVMLRDMLFTLPPFTPLAILKWAIILLAFYLIADAVIAAAKGGRSRKTANRDQFSAAVRRSDEPDP